MYISILILVLMKQYSTTAIEREVLILEYTFLYSYSSTHFYTRIRTHETVLNYSYRDEALVLECTFLYSYS